MNYKYRELIEQEEVKNLHSQAALSAQHQRFGGADLDHRLPYKRDVDRIVHSKAYSRYSDKTQVIYLVDNDHVTHRALHVQLVSHFARGIAEILKLNLDLVEAIALGHDVGHPPFGHEGETYLSELSEEIGAGPFSHPLQSCRLLRDIEPLRLGLAVYDGFLCHDGAMKGNQFVPRWNKTWDDHAQDLAEKKKNPHLNIMPGTLEGCLVKICDTMSYVGRDIEDAIQVGIIQRGEVPQTRLGTTNREILSVLAQDVIEESYGKDYIAVSEPTYEALHVLRSFNFHAIYNHPKLKVESSKIKKGYRLLVMHLMEETGEDSVLQQEFLRSRTPEYLSHTSRPQQVIDYVAGMTDRYFIRSLEKGWVPHRISL